MKPLHILYIVQYFSLPSDSDSSRAHQFARRWVQSGHRVTVLTSNLSYKTMANSRLPAIQTIDGVTVIRLRTYNKIRGGYWKRYLNFLSFALLALFKGCRIKDFDLVYASSTPLTAGLPGYLLSLLRQKPFFFEVRDLWPEAAVVAGALKNRSLILIAEFLEKTFYSRAVKVVALSRGIEKGVIQKGKHPQDVMLIPNGVDDWMLESKGSFLPDLGFSTEDNLICTYIGAHGQWNGLDTILECAHYLVDTNIKFLFIGDGSYKQGLVTRAEELGLANVSFHEPIPKQRIFEYLQHSHVALIAAWNHPFHSILLPNKIFDYMAAGCPIVAAARGEMAELIKAADCGWTVTPERPDKLATLLQAVGKMSQKELKQKGANGRAYVIRKYLRRDFADQLERLFLEQRTSQSRRILSPTWIR